MATKGFIFGQRYNFYPHGPGGYPQFRVLEIDSYQPGASKLDHFRVEAKGSADTEEIEELPSWAAVQTFFEKAGYDEHFKKEFPGVRGLRLDELNTRTERKPDSRTERHDAMTDAAQAILGAEVTHRDAKTARLKEARLAKAIEIEPEKPKKK